MTTTTRTRTLRLISISLLAATAAAGLMGCEGGGGGRSSMDIAQPTKATEPAMVNDSAGDAEFIDGMIYYSQLNQQLADLELSGGLRPAVQELAEKIKRRESVDIAFLQAERTRLGITRAPRALENDPHAVDDRRRMQAASPEEADAFYVEHMIKHRLEIAKFAEAHAAGLSSPNLSYFCRTVSEDAGRELRELRSVQSAERTIPANARAGVRGLSNSRSR